MSVIVPVHAGERFLGAALDSIAAQTHPRVETIVIDDGSPDRSAEIASARAGVRVLRQERAGVAAARNAGASPQREGELLAFLDQDDEWHPAKLARQVATLRERTDVALVLTHMHIVLTPGTPAPVVVSERMAGATPARLHPQHLARAPGHVRADRPVRHHICHRLRLRLARAVQGRRPGRATAMLPDALVTWRIHGANGSYDQQTMHREMLRMMRGSANRQRETDRDRPETVRQVRRVL